MAHPSPESRHRVSVAGLMRQLRYAPDEVVRLHLLLILKDEVDAARRNGWSRLLDPEDPSLFPSRGANGTESRRARWGEAVGDRLPAPAA